MDMKYYFLLNRLHCVWMWGFVAILINEYPGSNSLLSFGSDRNKIAKDTVLHTYFQQCAYMYIVTNSFFWGGGGGG